MEWDWKTEGYAAFKWVAAIVVTWLGNMARKRAKPAYQNFKKFIKLSSEVESIKNDALTRRRRVDITNNLLLAKFKIDEKPLFIVDNKGELEFVNDAWLKLTGFHNPQDAYNGGFLLAIPEADRAKIEAQGERLTQHPAPYSGIITFQHIHTGKLIKTFCRTEIVYDYENNFHQTVGRLDIIE